MPRSLTLGSFLRISLLLALASALTACGKAAPSGDTVSGSPAAKEITDNKPYDDGEHIVYFSAIPSDLINADVAKTYQIVRSKNKALVNVSVHKKNDDNSTTAINAQLTPKVANLTGQLKNMTLKRIAEQDAVYYIGTVNVSNGETLLFDFNIKPSDSDKDIEIKFKQSFYSE